MEFPRKRFERVGASQAELDAMQAEFDASSAAAQRSLVDRVAPLPDSAVAAMLDGYRVRQSAEAEPVEVPARSRARAAASSVSKSAESGDEETAA